MRTRLVHWGLAGAIIFSVISTPRLSFGQDRPFYLKDRGPGIPTSMFGTYVQKGEWIVYPFFEYYLDDNYEYSPSEFGLGLDQDYRGRYRESEWLMFLAYGFSDRLAVEAEAAMTRASLVKSPSDLSGMPDKLAEKGLGDVQVELRWMWSKETERRPGFFSYGEVVLPHHKTKYLIGTPDLETKAGVGLIKGFRWGTVIVRAAVEQAGGVFDLGEYAVEYYKRLSKSVCVYAGIEGTQDELELISEVQLWLSDTVRFKINNAFGLTSKATGWAPEIGIMVSFPKHR
jgi:hypothetical protein